MANKQYKIKRGKQGPQPEAVAVALVFIAFLCCMALCICACFFDGFKLT